MKKGLIITLIVLVIFILMSVTICIMLNKNISKSDMTMTIKEGTLARTSATVSIKDNDTEHCYGEDYRIEKKEDGEWRCLDQIGVYGITLMALSPGKETKELKFDIDWSERYGELENGEYRIVKSVDTAEGKRELYAEFTLE